jgi:ERCC4-type nuclease
VKDIAVVADDRERGSGVIRSLQEAEGATVAVERLQTGDYRVGIRLLFERKTLPDFALSIVQGRLFSQMQRLASCERRGVLLLEGTGKDLANVSVRRESMQGALITTSLLMDIPVLRSRCAEESARLMLYAARQVAGRVSGGVYRHGYRPRGRRRRQLHVLQGLPGVGPGRAEKLLEAFGNVERVMAASEEELSEVDGIGAKTAHSIRLILREQPPPYITHC